MTTLVTGATGLVGRLVVQRLLDEGVAVRALTRRPAEAGLPSGVEVVPGDLTEPATVAPALADVDRMYLFPVPATAGEVVAAAKQAGVRRIVVLSAQAVTVGWDTAYHPVVERAVEESGLEWTHVRPGEFMANMLPIWGPSIRAERVVRYPYGDQVVGVPVHEADIAEVVTTSLLDDGHAGKAYTLSGPAPLSVRQEVEAISAALGEEIRYEEVSRERARELLKAQGGVAAMSADFLLGFMDYGGAPTGSEGDGGSEGGGSEGDGAGAPDLSVMLRPWPGVQEATGHPARTYAEWARDHVDDFR
jgi:uncharacterized protein YbjT (DUF2867 family)